MTAPKSNNSTTATEANPTERPSSVLERLLLDVEEPDDILIDVSRRSTTTGRVKKLTTVGTPPPELTLDEFILNLFGGGRFALRFRIRGQRGQRAVETAELDLRGYEERKDPPQGWAAYFNAMERGEVPEGDEETDELGADVAELRGADPLLAQLLMDARGERRTAQERYENERRTAEEYRRAQDQRTHEILLALIQRPAPEPVLAGVATPSSPYASKIEKVLMDRALESVLGGGGGGGGASSAAGGEDDDLDDLFAGKGGLGKLLRPALEGFGARFADMMGGDDDDDDDGGDFDGDDGELDRELERDDLQAEAELARQRRAGRARARAIHEEKARRAQQRSAGAGSDPTPGGRKDPPNGSPETSIPPPPVPPSSPEHDP